MLIEFPTFESARRRQEDFSSIQFQYDAGQLVADMGVDFNLTVGAQPMILEYGGVPYGDPEVAGYTGLSDFIRSGGTSEAYVAAVNNGSLSDILRGDVPSPGFDPTVYNSNGASVVKDWNITSVIDSITKGIASIGGVALGAVSLAKGSTATTRSSGTGARDTTGAGKPSLASTMFGGLLPGAGGNMPQLLMWGAILTAGGFLVYTLARR